MNFDDLKKDWKEENTDKVDLSINLSQKREAATAIDKIRKRMKNEYIVNVLLTVVAVLFVGYKLAYNDVRVFTILVVFIYMGSWAILTAFYLKRFKDFYNKSYHLEYSSLENLLWFSYEMRLNLDAYKLLSFSSAIVGFGAAVMFIGLELSNQYMTMLSEVNFSSIETYWPLLAMAIYFIVMAFVAFSLIRMAIRGYEKPFQKIQLSIKYLQEFGDFDNESEKA
ncbi:hypothetical protein GCM10022216_12040 [Sphingobacterium kyonggiense]|uniref:ABC transporter permease n=1 Tax=Sphingobacterium kyonggiense TaxID=714075 RepID=A0ABP7YJL3_9SPHI